MNTFAALDDEVEDVVDTGHPLVNVSSLEVISSADVTDPNIRRASLDERKGASDASSAAFDLGDTGEKVDDVLVSVAEDAPLAPSMVWENILGESSSSSDSENSDVLLGAHEKRLSHHEVLLDSALLQDDDRESVNGYGVEETGAAEDEEFSAPHAVPISTGSSQGSSCEEDPRLTLSLLPKKKKKASSGLLASAVNLCNTVIGGGTLAIPFAFAAGGFFVATWLLVAMAILQIYSLWIICRLKRLTGIETYKGLAFRALRTKYAGHLVDFCICGSTYGTLIAYCVIIGDLFPPVIHFILGPYADSFLGKIVSNREVLMCFYAICLMLPLFCLRNLSALRYTSLLAMIAILYLVVIVAFRSNDYQTGGEPRLSNVSMDVFLSLPIITFAFTCQFNILPLYRELKNPTVLRINTIILLSILFVLLVYLLVGMFGFITFADTVKGNILINYEEDDGWVVAGRIAVSFTITFSYPVIGFSCRESVLNILFKNRDKHKFARFYLTTLMILFSTLIIGIFVPDIAVILDFSGAIFSSAVCYFFPGLFFVVLAKRKFYHPLMIVSFLLTIFGLLTIVVCTSATVYHQVTLH